jgi:hypothetical protein
MQRTIYGETHKTKVIGNDKLNSIILKELNCYKNTSSEKTLYPNAFSLSDPSLNFLNSITDAESFRTLRKLVEHEYDSCETFCAGTGEIFLNLFFSYLDENKHIFIRDNNEKEFYEKIELKLEKLYSELSENNVKVNKDLLLDFIDRFESQKAKNHFIDVLNKSEISTTVFIDESNFTDTQIKKVKNCSFNLSFDKDFLLGKSHKTIKDFHFILIDGFIDSVGEVHHLLHKAAETKENYVLVCKGMREDVKYAIYQNLLRGTINLFPISLETNELNVNILADFAACLDGDVVSYLTGTNISTAVRRDLKKANKIIISSTGIMIEPMNTDRLNRHVSYLRKKAEETEFDVNRDIINKRIKFVTADRVEVKIPKKNLDKAYIRDFLRMLGQMRLIHSGVSDNVDFKNYPTKMILFALKKCLSLLKIVYNTRCCVILDI